MGLGPIFKRHYRPALAAAAAAQCGHWVILLLLTSYLTGQEPSRCVVLIISLSGPSWDRRALALGSSQDRCMWDLVQIQLDKPSWLQGLYLFTHHYIVHTGNSPLTVGHSRPPLLGWEWLGWLQGSTQNAKTGRARTTWVNLPRKGLLPNVTVLLRRRWVHLND